MNRIAASFAFAGALVLTGAIAPAPLDPQISDMVGSVSQARLESTERALVAFGTRNDFSETTSTKAHGVFGARDWIRSQFDAIAKHTDGRMTVALDTFEQPKNDRTPRSVEESNIVATLRGEDPDLVYVISSHYDDCNGDCTNGTREAPGADDNGSGTAAVLEAARVMAPHHFRGTIVFAVFDGEELGLWGSQHFADELHARGVNVVADLNNDIIGNSTGGDGTHEPDVIRAFSQALPADAKPPLVNLLGSENDSPSRELARFAGDVIPQYVDDFRVRQIWRADRFLRGGDQESFQADGYAAIRFVEAHENFTHQHQDVRVENGVQYGDLLAYLDFAYLARATQANVSVLAALALGPEAPQHAQLVLRHLGYDSTLRWTASAGAVSYEIVWRDTTASTWENAKDVGDVTEATVPVSYDDNVLGVRSVDAQGRRSVVSYPEPVRVP
jgi:hypothetical protein